MSAFFLCFYIFFFSSRRRHTIYISVTGVQTCVFRSHGNLPDLYGRADGDSPTAFRPLVCEQDASHVYQREDAEDGDARLLLAVLVRVGRRGPRVAHPQAFGELARGVDVARAPLVAVNLLEPYDVRAADLRVFPEQLNEPLEVVASAVTYVVGGDLQLGRRGRG